MAVDLVGCIVDMVRGALPGAVLGAVPNAWKSELRARIEDANPFSTISGNHDLLRAVRLAWITAAIEVLDAVKDAARHPEFAARKSDVADFAGRAYDRLASIRLAAFRREAALGSTAIDEHAQAVLKGTPEFISPSSRHPAGVSLTDGFVLTLARVTEDHPDLIDELFGRVARDGAGEPPRSFGELVLAAFAEILKHPVRYPEASEAFHIYTAGAIDALAREILVAVQGIDGKLDAALAGISALKALGAEDYLKHLPGIAAGVSAIQGDLATLPDRLIEALERRYPDAVSAGQRDRVIALGRLSNPDVATFEQSVDELAARLKRLEELEARLKVLTAEDPALREVRDDSLHDLAAGYFGKAAAALDAAATNQSGTLGATNRDGETRVYLALAIDAALMVRDVEAAARHIADDAYIAHGYDAFDELSSIRSAVEDWHGRAAGSGLALDYEVAVALQRRLVEQSYGRQQREALAQLRNMLMEFAERTRSEGALRELVGLARNRLERTSAEDQPAEFAQARAEFSTALNALEQRRGSRA